MKYKCTRNSQVLTIARRHPSVADLQPNTDPRCARDDVVGSYMYSSLLIGLLAFSGGLLANSVSQSN